MAQTKKTGRSSKYGLPLKSLQIYIPAKLYDQIKPVIRVYADKKISELLKLKK